MNISDWKVVENTCLAEYELTLRTWKERLFSWPWKPWQKYKHVEKANNNIIVDEHMKVIYASPATCDRLLEEFVNHD